MFLEERRQNILSLLEKNERSTVNELSGLFHVSKETIRSDLNFLAEHKFITRCYGGAIYLRKCLQENIIKRQGSNIESIFEKIKEIPSEYIKGRRMIGKVCILGSFNVDIVAKVPRFPQGGESLLALNSTLGPGGKGANQAQAASKAGANVHFVSKVGKDQFSQFAFKHLETSEIRSFTLYQSEDKPTGNAIIYVSEENGENMIAIYPGANQTITDDEVAATLEQLKTANILLVQLENNLSATINMMKLAKSLHIPVILNPAPYSEKVWDCLPYIDVITPNETEASQLSGIKVTDIDSARQAAECIIRRGVPQVIITLGAHGVLIHNGEQARHIPAFPALSVDTTGAGDAFNGALAAALAKGQNLLQAATYAAAFASLAVEREGASAMPTHEQVMAKLERHNQLLN